MSKVRIIYKSGAEVTVKCDNFTVSKNAFGEILEVKWSDDIQPRPLFAGVDEIAAIWVLR